MLPMPIAAPTDKRAKKNLWLLAIKPVKPKPNIKLLVIMIIQ